MSFFHLELDTIGPQISIVAPVYTSSDALTYIRITSNEKLSFYQDIYIIDSLGNRYNLNFSYNTNEFIGEVYFNNLSLGIATIYAQVKDEVDNISNLATFNINIVKGQKIKVISNYSFNRPKNNLTFNKSRVNYNKNNVKINIERLRG